MVVPSYDLQDLGIIKLTLENGAHPTRTGEPEKPTRFDRGLGLQLLEAGKRQWTRLQSSGEDDEMVPGVGVVLSDAVDMDPMHSSVGPFYDSAGAMKQLRLETQAALLARRERQNVLAMQTLDGTWLYPAWQFTEDGGIHEELTEVLDALRGVDRWVAGLWLVNPHESLGRVSPRQALREGADPHIIAVLASQVRGSFAN